VFLDEAGFLLTPVVRRTLAPRGVTPLLPVSGKGRRKGSGAICSYADPKRLPTPYPVLIRSATKQR
jgi:hypothetical protein